MKKLIALILSILCLTGTVLAAEPAENMAQTPESLLSIYLTPFYEDDFSNYLILSSDGTDITTTFYNTTIEDYLSNDWAAIKEAYYLLNVEQMSKTNPSSANMSRSTITETEEQDFYKLMECTADNGMTREVGIILTGTIRYDSSTLKLTAWPLPELTYIAVSGGPCDYTTPALTSVKNTNYKATFGCSFEIWADLEYEGEVWGSFDFGTFRASFSMYSND